MLKNGTSRIGLHGSAPPPRGLSRLLIPMTDKNIKSWKKKDNFAGWQGKGQANRKRFFRSPIGTGGHHDSCDLIWKIAFTFVEKIDGDIFKADSAQSKQTTFIPKGELA